MFPPNSYPCLIGIFCDRCGVTDESDYLVHEGWTREQMLACARRYLSTQGWRCDASGDFCPEHAGVDRASPGEAAPDRALAEAERFWRERAHLRMEGDVSPSSYIGATRLLLAEYDRRGKVEAAARELPDPDEWLTTTLGGRVPSWLGSPLGLIRAWESGIEVDHDHVDASPDAVERAGYIFLAAARWMRKSLAETDALAAALFRDPGADTEEQP